MLLTRRKTRVQRASGGVPGLPTFSRGGSAEAVYDSTVGDTGILVRDATAAGGTGETLTFPTRGVINLSQGVILQRMYLAGDVLAATPTRPYIFFWHSSSGFFNMFALTREDIGGTYKWAATTTLSSGPSAVASVAQTLTAGLHTIAMRWHKGELSLWINGSKVASVANPNLPSGLGANLSIGGDASRPQYNTNTAVVATHLFDEALPDALMAAYTTAPPAGPTDKHTLFLPFDGNLATFGRGFSLGDYQETFADDLS